MYCVRCGVKLQDGVKKCPLCQTPVLIEDDLIGKETPKYSELFPKEEKHGKYFLLGLITAVMIAAALACLIVCLKVYGSIGWSAIVMSAILLGYVIFVLPCWFSKWHPMIFLPVDTGAICLFLLHVCLYCRGRWFLTFALPLTLLVGATIIVATVLYTYVKGGRLFITGGLLVAFGLITMLIEFFVHLTYGTPMFLWSLYSVSIFAALGLFLIIAGIIRPLREYLDKKFFY